MKACVVRPDCNKRKMCARFFMNTLATLLFFSCGTLLSSRRALVKNNHLYFVILAGGNGERLWPYSRRNRPKQLLEVGSEKSLLEQTIDRAVDLAQKETIWVITTEIYDAMIRDLVGDSIGHVIVEPDARNTGPAILLSCLEIQKRDPDAVVVFLAADHFIASKESFVSQLKSAINFVFEHDHIALLGLKPTYPATGYGYIEYDPYKHAGASGLYKVTKFHEKPNLEFAKEYIEAGNMLWNSGMFCGRVSVFVEEFKHYAPEVFYDVQEYLNGAKSYSDVKSISIDFAVMEKSYNTYVLPVDFPWCDVGNIERYLLLKKAYGNLAGDCRYVNTYNNLVDVKGKLVALIGVHDLCVVEMDDVLLISKMEETERVKEIVNQLKKEKDTSYL